MVDLELRLTIILGHFPHQFQMQIEEAVEAGVCYIASISPVVVASISPVTINHMKKMVKLWKSSVQDMIEKA